MRQERTAHPIRTDYVFATHEIGCVLKAMSQWLDEHCDLLGARPMPARIKATGRLGLPAGAELRYALLTQDRQRATRSWRSTMSTPPRFAHLRASHGRGAQRRPRCKRRSRGDPARDLGQTTTRACFWALGR